MGSLQFVFVYEHQLEELVKILHYTCCISTWMCSHVFLLVSTLKEILNHTPCSSIGFFWYVFPYVPSRYRVIFFDWSPPKFSKYKSLYNLWHLEKFRASLHGILYLENLGGLQLKKSPCRWQNVPRFRKTCILNWKQWKSDKLILEGL